MGRIEIFRIELVDRASGAALTLAGGRQFDQTFYLDLGDIPLRLWPEQAMHFARCVQRMVWRRQQARSVGMAPKAGVGWRQTLGDGVNPNFNVELGLGDDGLVYVEVGSIKVRCDAAQDDDLVHALSRFVDDINFVDAASPNAPSTSLRVAGCGQRPVNIALRLRGFLMPWEVDPSW